MNAVFLRKNGESDYGEALASTGKVVFRVRVYCFLGVEYIWFNF